MGCRNSIFSSFLLTMAASVVRSNRMKSVRSGLLVAIFGAQLVMIVMFLLHRNCMTCGMVPRAAEDPKFQENHGMEQLFLPAEEDGQKTPTDEQTEHALPEEEHQGTENKTEALPPPLRICKKHPAPATNDGSERKVGGYQCQGEEYEEFGRKLLALGNKGKKDSPMWGRRQRPFPSDKTILFFGNSHTRQLLETLLCEYNDFVKGWGRSKIFPDSYTTIKMKHNTTVLSVHNSWMAHSDQWVSLLEQHVILGPLSSVDVFVLGLFNGIPASQKTNFQKGMLQARKKHPEMNPNRNGPEFDEVAKAYQGVIVSVGTMADKDLDAVKAEQERVREYQLNGRENVASLDPRKYVPIHDECGTNIQFGFGTCQNGDNGKDQHRCTGAYGGPFDLIAWDLIETLNGLL
jgi:hypothetical protein